jgi:ankyrin repeat protein
LIASGALVDKVDDTGSSAIFYAMINNNESIARLLISLGASRSQWNTAGQSLEHIWKEKGWVWN